MKSISKFNFWLGFLAVFSMTTAPVLAQANRLNVNTGRVNVRMSENGTLSISTNDRDVNVSPTRLEVPSYRSTSWQRRDLPHYSSRGCQSRNHQSSRISRIGNSRVYTRQSSKVRVC